MNDDDDPMPIALDVSEKTEIDEINFKDDISEKDEDLDNSSQPQR